jgi:hypothetical protein
MEHRNSTELKQDSAFLSSVIERELEHRGNDILGARSVLIDLGCSIQQAEAALGSYLCRRSELQRKPPALQGWSKGE